MNQIGKISALTLMLLSLGTPLALAQTQPQYNFNRLTQAEPGNPPQPGNRGEKLFEQLNLTPEQQQKMQALRNDTKQKMSSIQQSLRQAGQEIQQMMAGTANENQLRQKHKQIQQLQQQLGDIRFDNMLKMREILTPEQRSKLAELMQQRRQNRPQGFNRNRNS